MKRRRKDDHAERLRAELARTAITLVRLVIYWITMHTM